MLPILPFNAMGPWPLYCPMFWNTLTFLHIYNIEFWTTLSLRRTKTMGQGNFHTCVNNRIQRDRFQAATVRTFSGLQFRPAQISQPIRTLYLLATVCNDLSPTYVWKSKGWRIGYLLAAKRLASVCRWGLQCMKVMKHASRATYHCFKTQVRDHQN